MGPVVADGPEGLVGIRNDGRPLVGTDRGNALAHIRDPAGVVDDHFLRLVASEILEFPEHLLGGPKVEGRLVVCVLKALAVHDDAPVHLILRVQEMDVAGGADRLFELFPEGDDFPVQIPEILLVLYIALLIPDQELVVADGLDFQIIVETHDLSQLRVRNAPLDGPKQFSRLAGRTQNQAFPVLHEKALGDPRPPAEVIQAGFRYQPVEVDASQVILGKDNDMVGGKLHDGLRTHLAQRIQRPEIVDIPRMKHLQKPDKDFRRCAGIIHRPVMILQ